MTLKCKGVAQRLGQKHNESAGVSPLIWLDDFGMSLNLGSGLKDRNRPLPLICRASPTDSTMTAFEDGRKCPSLQNFLEVAVEEVSIRLHGELEGAVKDEGRYRCRMRLLGNPMSRPPLALGDLVYQPDSGLFSLGMEANESRPTMYPIHHNAESTLVVFEVRLIIRGYRPYVGPICRPDLSFPRQVLHRWCASN